MKGAVLRDRPEAAPVGGFQSCSPGTGTRAKERREPGPLMPRLLWSAFGCPWLSLRAGDHERSRPPVPLVGGAVRCLQTLLLVHGAEDDVEGDERREDRAIHRHAGQEQEEPQS